MNSRWHRATAISCIFHFIVLLGAGWLAGAVTVPPVVEQFIELELADPGRQGSGDGGQPAAAPEPAVPAAAVQQVAAQTVPDSVPVEEVLQPQAQPQVVAAAEALAMVEADAPAAGAGGQSGSAAGSGGSGAADGTGSGSGESGQGSGSQGISQPGILNKVDPAYPQAARNAGQTGTVVLRIQILTNGRPGTVSVAASSGYSSLDESAVAAVKRWQFIPAKDLGSGKTVVCYTTLPVIFQLKG